MTFDDWLRAFDRALRQSDRDVRVKDLDPVALREAYDQGISPIAFSKSPALPRRTQGVKATRPKPTYVWIPFALLLVLGAGAFRYVRDFSVARAGKERLEMIKKWPADLPIKTESGPYYPEGAVEAERLAEEHIQTLLLQPKGAVFSKVAAAKFNRPDAFQVDGEVESINAFNARVIARWSVWINRRGEKIDYRIVELEASKQSSIWKSDDTTRTGGIPEKRAPSKTLTNSTSYAATPTALHAQFIEAISAEQPRTLKSMQRFKGTQGQNTRMVSITDRVKAFVWSIPTENYASYLTITLTNTKTLEKTIFNPAISKADMSLSMASGAETLELKPGQYTIDIQTDAATWWISILQAD